MIRSLVAAAMLLVLPGAALAGPVLYPRAQALADGIVARNPGMLDVILHVSPTLDAKNIVIAAHLTNAIGETSGDDIEPTLRRAFAIRDRLSQNTSNRAALVG